MSIAGANRSAAGHGHRVERRNRRRTARSAAHWIGGIAAWGLLFFGLGWLVAAGFYGLLMNQ
jgi:hypothetical protein